METIEKKTSRLSAKKRALLQALIEEKKARKSQAAAVSPTGQAPPLERRRVDDPLLLSFGQERLWFLQQLEPEKAAYRIPAAVRLKGPLRARALERSIREIIRRHETLRSAFRADDGRPRVRIAEDLDFRLPKIDLEALPSARREEAARELVAVGAARPFDLARGPLFRLELMRLAERDHVLLLVLHHTISDTWSVGVFIREMALLYEGFCGGREARLPPLSIQYVDFALWQRSWLRGEVLERQLDYWRRQLDGVSPVLELPTDRPRPALQTFRGSRCYMTLGRELTDSIKELGRHQGVSTFMTVLAALASLLHRYSGQSDVLVGTPYSNRTQRALEGLIGFFVNTLVLKSSFDRNPRVVDLLAQVRETTLGAYAHSDVPFERIVEELRLERDLSRNPLWQVDFAFQNAPMPELEAVGLSLSRFEIEERASRFDLELDLRDTPEGYSGWIGYNHDLFEAATIGRMVRHFENLLRSVVADPDRRISQLDLLSAEERREVLAMRGRRRSFAAETPIPGRFKRQVERRPQALAVSCGDEHLTYGELERRATSLAGALSRRGVGPEVRVGVSAQRGTELVTALLGVLEAGGAYVPLDPDYPRERLEYLLEDSGLRWIVADDSAPPWLDSLPRISRLSLQAESDAEPPALSPRLAADHLAYVIYTSGSTGKPKGVEIAHRQVGRLLDAADEEFDFTVDDAWSFFHSYAFDFSVWEIWGCLLHGGRSVVVPYWVSRSPGTFHDLLIEQRVTVLSQTPSAFYQLMQADAEAEDSAGLALRTVVFGGEALELAALAPWIERHGDCSPRLVNMYGITETTVHVTYRALRRRDLENAPRSVIGRPLADLDLYLLDDELELAPMGVRGEIYVGGAGLARGYLERPGLTASRFVPDPWSAAPGGRLYASGDLGRRLADGDVQYLGRSDHQVKIRGFRIELGEIEAALLEHPAVSAAAVLLHDEATGARLLAYFVSPRDPAPAVGELRAFLKEKLPDYMVPASFVALDELPLTAHGKLDRRALPRPQPDRPTLEQEYVAPRSSTEESLAEIWSDILGLEHIGARDDFFDLGGQSLLATQVISRMQQRFDVELSLRTLFQHSTLEQLANTVEEARASGVSGVPPIRPVPRDGDLPLSFAQERLWFVDQLTPDLTAYNVPGAVRLTGPLVVGTLEAAITALIDRHEVLRTTFDTVGGQPVQVIRRRIVLRLPIVDLRRLAADAAEAEAQALASREARWIFDLHRGPLLRGLLLRLADNVHVLVLNIHHIVYDMWSRVIFIRELGLLYEAFTAGRPSPLTPLPVQYADFAHWQRRQLGESFLEPQLAYWRRQLEGIPSRLDLPTDRPRPKIPSFRGARVYLDLGTDLSRRLEDLGSGRGVTLFILLLSGFMALLHRYTTQRDLVVGSPIANRNRIETEGLMGFFANTLVLRSKLGEQSSFVELLEQLRETSLGAFAHQDLAFERIVGDLQPDRDQARHPLVQVLFNFIQNYRPPDMILGHLTLSPEWVHNGASAFEFTCSLWQADGRLQGSIDYSVELFDRTTITRLAAHFTTLLASAAEAPESAVSELRMVSAGEGHQLLQEWPVGTAGNDGKELFPELFAASVARRPETTALRMGDRSLTFRELDRLAGRLARALAARGVGSDVAIAILIPRSLEMAVAVLGVLAAGGAYVPLDPAAPRERTSRVLDELSQPLILTRESFRGQLDGSADVLTVDLERLSGGDGEDPPPLRLRPTNLAYVIYTSGSTGRPKGVMCNHGALANYLRWCRHAYPGGGGGSAVHSPLGFDLTVTSLLHPLAVGDPVTLLPEEEGPQALAEVLRSDAELDLLKLTPSHLALLSQLMAETGPRASIEALIVGGETLEWATVDAWRRHAPGTRLINEYGPTEAMVGCSTYEAPTGGLGTRRGAAVSIGRPISGLRLTVVDAGLRPVPTGVYGEICIGGAGLARGYHRRPAETAERFVPDPGIGAAPGARWLRSGDLARWRSDGRLEFLGRRDHQVKIRGFRIELEDIEAALAEHPDLRGCAVSVQDDGDDLRLVAYVTADEDRSPTAEELQTFLRRRLPEYMLPASFIALSELPLTRNGKIDRAALSELRGEQVASGTLFVAPRNDTERRLVELWSKLLPVEPEKLGVHDNFFHLGGHSLLTTRLLSRVRDLFDREVPLPAFFEDPTVAGLATILDLVLDDVVEPMAAEEEAEEQYEEIEI